MYPNFIKTRLAKNLENVKEDDIISNVRLLVDGMGLKTSENWFFETKKIMDGLAEDYEALKEKADTILHDEKGEWSDYYDYDPSTDESTLVDLYNGYETFLKVIDYSVTFTNYRYQWQEGDDEDKFNIPDDMEKWSYKTTLSAADMLKMARLLQAWKVEKLLTSGSKEEAEFRETRDEYNPGKIIIIKEALLRPGVRVVGRRCFYPYEMTARYDSETVALVVDESVTMEEVLKGLEDPSNAVFNNILEVYFPVWSRHLQKLVADIVSTSNTHWGYPVGEFADWYVNLGGKDVVWSLHEKLYPLLYRN